jgi:hypothetical protein
MRSVKILGKELDSDKGIPPTLITCSSKDLYLHGTQCHVCTQLEQSKLVESFKPCVALCGNEGNLNLSLQNWRKGGRKEMDMCSLVTVGKNMIPEMYLTAMSVQVINLW